MTTRNAYILGTLNSAVYFEDKKAKILHGDSNVISALDGYIWSQYCAIKPEYKEVRFDSIDMLLLQTNEESRKYEALELSLELMDIGLSLEYKSGIAKYLGELLNQSNESVTFTINRLYSTPLPEKFDPDQAYNLLFPEFNKAGDFYSNLKLKTTLFSCFYTLFKLGLKIELEKQDQLDQILTDSGCYSKFTIALYETSKKKYDSASFEVLKQLIELHISYPPNIFFEIEQKLKFDYEILLNDKPIDIFVQRKNINSDEENDEIIQLIENYYTTRQVEHDTKKAKRGNAKKVEAFVLDIRDIVEALKDWTKKHAYKGDEAFLHEFKDIIVKQLKSSKPEQICKTCCDMASYFIEINRFELSKKLLTYAKRFNSEDYFIYTQEAEHYNKAGDLQKALKLYNLAIQKFSDNVVAYSGKAETLRDMGRFADALQQYNDTIEKFGNNVVVYNGKAETLRDMGRFADALQQYNDTIEKFGNDVVAYSGKAETLRDMGRFADALEQYNGTIEKFGNDVFAYNGKAETLRDMGRFADALQQYNDTIEKFSDNVVAYSGKAETLRDMGRFADALQQYNDTIEKFGDNVVAYSGKAETLRDMGRFADALQQYNDTIEKFGNDVVAYSGKAETLRDMGRFAEALQQYNEAIEKFSNSVVAYSGKAETLRDMGRFADALQQYNDTIEKFGDNVVVYNGKAETLRDMGRFAEALQQYNDTIEKFGNDVVAYNGKAETLRDMGRFADALEQYNDAIEKFGDNVVAYSGKAETLRDMGRFADALQQYNDILKKYTENRIAKTGQLKLLLETDQLEEQLETLNKNKHETYDDYFNLHIYSMFLIKKGEWDEALNMINVGLKSPFYQNRPYFRGLASYLRILQKDYKTALSYFDFNDSNKPVENLLATHAFAASDQISKAKEVLHKLDIVEKPIIKTTLSYLSERYTLNGFKMTGKSKEELDTLIIEGETIALLRF